MSEDKTVVVPRCGARFLMNGQEICQCSRAEGHDGLHRHIFGVDYGRTTAKVEWCSTAGRCAEAAKEPSPPNSERFWVVMCKDNNGPPARCRESHEAAMKEAGRLAQQSGSPYYVLKAVCVVEPIEVPVNYREL